MKTWLKGGLIGFILGILIDLLFLYTRFLNYHLISYLGFPWAYLSYGFLGIVINGLIIGAILGLIIGKLKSNN